MQSPRLLAIALLAAMSSAAFAQVPMSAPRPPEAQAPHGQPRHGMREHGRFDPARFEQRMAQRQAELKARLQITPAQEGAWNAWVAAVKPSPEWMAKRRAAREEMQRLTTPERIDRMRALRTERATQMDRSAEATKVFYATLTPYQKGVFDTASLRHGGGGRHHHRRG